MSKQKFWMVLGLGTPTFRHETRDSARVEAERLARINPGQEFVVLESMATVVKSDLAWSVHADCDEPGEPVPF